MGPIDVAKSLVRQRFPRALAAFLGGSSVTPARTATSDLDIVVVRSEGPTYRETASYRGWIVELFLSVPDTYERILVREVAGRRSPLAHMVGRGVVLVDFDGTASRLRDAAAELLKQGPPPASGEQIEDLRYGLSNLVDDLSGVTDSGERIAIAAAVFRETAVLALTLSGSWLGNGKWLSRHLRAADPELHDALMSAFREAVVGEKSALAAVAAGVLERAGGRLVEGYRREMRFDG